MPQSRPGTAARKAHGTHRCGVAGWQPDYRLHQPGRNGQVLSHRENKKAFGRPGASRGSSAFPKIRFVALLENGTHVLWAARMSKYKTDELTLAKDVVPALQKGMLCLADRFFPSYKLWKRAAQTGADLLWRTRQNARLDVENACQTALTSAASTLPLRTGGSGGMGLWSASSITACRTSKTPNRCTG
jgi:hypothetical protein